MEHEDGDEVREEVAMAVCSLSANVADELVMAFVR